MARKKTDWTDLNQSNLKKIIHYDAATGLLTWIVYRSRIARAGGVAGNVGNQGYVAVKINGKLYKAHRLAWLYTYGFMPEEQVDHINGIRDDNRISNLRLASHGENARNAKIRKDSTTGFRGVHCAKGPRAYRARITVNGKTLELGGFPTPLEASLAYEAAARKYHKSFANPGRKDRPHYERR